MNISAINIILILLFTLVMSGKNTAKRRKWYIIIVSFFLLLEASLRGVSVGSDTPNYYYYFMTKGDMTWSELWESFIARYRYGMGEGDIGYSLLIKMIHNVTNSWQVYVFIAGLLFFIPFGIFMYRHAKDFLQLSLGFTLYCALMHVFVICGARQVYALGLCVLAFLFFENNKKKLAFISLLAGATLHMSALLFILPLGLSYFSNAKIKAIHLLSLCLIPVVLMFVNQIIIFLGNMAGSERYAAYGKAEIAGGSGTFIALLELLSFGAYLSFKKNVLDSDRIKSYLYTMVPCFTFFGPLIWANGSMIRISLYFHLFLVILLPYMVDILTINGKRKFVYRVLILGLLVLSVIGSGGWEYEFYWNDPYPRI